MPFNFHKRQAWDRQQILFIGCNSSTVTVTSPKFPSTNTSTYIYGKLLDEQFSFMTYLIISLVFDLYLFLLFQGAKR